MTRMMDILEDALRYQGFKLCRSGDLTSAVCVPVCAGLFFCCVFMISSPCRRPTYLVANPIRLSHPSLDGSTAAPARQQLIDLFNRPGSDVHVFLLSTRAGRLLLSFSNHLAHCVCNQQELTRRRPWC